MISIPGSAAVVRADGGAIAGPCAGGASRRSGAQCRHKRLSGVGEQRFAGSDRISEARFPLSVAGARARTNSRPTTNHAIKIENCESAKTADLLRVLGYRMRGGCGAEVVLETVNATRAFLTIDSGFPLAQLEQSLADQPSVRLRLPAVPSARAVRQGILARALRIKPDGEFIDVFLSDPALCRLYLGLSKLDSETAEQTAQADAGREAEGVRARARFLWRHVPDPQRRRGRPGRREGMAGLDRTASGKSPKDGAAFFERLLTRDDGWVAAYYDALARINGPTRDYLLEPKRMQRFYTAMRGRITSPGPARPVFRASTDLMLLTQRLRIEPDGKPHIPGNLDVWKNLFIYHPHGKYDGKLTKAATGWKEPDDLIEALFALCRKAVENEPLKIYMAMTDLNRYRTKPLEAGDGGPSGSRIPPVRIAVSDVRRSAALRTRRSFSSSMLPTAITEIAGSPAEGRYGRDHAGAGGPVADFPATGLDCPGEADATLSQDPRRSPRFGTRASCSIAGAPE